MGSFTIIIKIKSSGARTLKSAQKKMDTLDEAEKAMAEYVIDEIMALDNILSGKLDKEGIVSHSGGIVEHRVMVKWHDGFRSLYAGTEEDPMKRPLLEVASGEELRQRLNAFFELEQK